MLSKKIKQVTSVSISLFNYQNDAWSNKHKIILVYLKTAVSRYLKETETLEYLDVDGRLILKYIF